MRQCWADLDSVSSLLPQLGQLLVPLFNLLIQALVLDFQLLKVYQMQPLSQLLLHNTPASSLIFLCPHETHTAACSKSCSAVGYWTCWA